MARQIYSRPSGDGERAAITGFQPQYLIAASITLHHLRKGTLEWIKLADPAAGTMDDFQIATPGRIDAYQVKWSQYNNNITYNSFISSSKDKDAPLLQLARGWQTLCGLYPDRNVVVHWLTNDQASTNDGTNIPVNDAKPEPCHFASFLEQVLFPVIKKNEPNPAIPNPWKPAWDKWLNTTQLPEQDRIAFLIHCELNLRYPLPTTTQLLSDDDKRFIDQIRKLADWIIDRVADPERQIQYSPKDILAALGISEIPGSVLKQNFPIDEDVYRPIESTIANLDELITAVKGGYIALIGSPGSGKSTLLTQYLRYKPVRLARYYAYVPSSRDISALRGESTSFLGSIINQYDSLDCRVGHALQTEDRTALLHRFKTLIDILHDKYTQDGMYSIILIDGLDHIHRELRPERSLLADLPSPEEIPEGVFFILGTQTLNLPDLPNIIRLNINDNNRFITISPLTRQNVIEITNTFRLQFKPDQPICDHIFDLSNGHPLALRYLLEKLKNAQDITSANLMLRNELIWKGDISTHYEGYWNQIRPDNGIVSILGLICRIPGYIDLRWINLWPDSAVLQRVNQYFGYLFRKDSEYKWALFHNSFRLFLIDKTRQIQPGVSPEDFDCRYHLILAERCNLPNIPPEIAWNRLYHLERSLQHNQILQCASQNSFRAQFYALRPLYSIWADIFSGLRSASTLQDPVALFRLMLAGQEYEIREEALGENKIDLPGILINIGEYEKALLHIRDGRQLMVSELAGLKYACLLYDLERFSESKEIFELSEPNEYLSGNSVLKVRSNQENTKLLKRWAKAAVRHRTLSNILSVIPNIRASWEIDRDSLKERNPSIETQCDIYLALGKELVFLERYDDFNLLFDHLGKNIADSFYVRFILLRNLYESYIYNSHTEDAKSVFKRLEELSKGHKLYEWQRLWFARTLATSNGDVEEIRKLITGVPLLQKPDDFYSSYYRPFDELYWDMYHVAIKYYINEDTDIVKLVPDDVEIKFRGSTLFRRAVAAIGRIIGSAWKGEVLDVATIRQIYLPLIRLFYQDIHTDQIWTGWHYYRGDRGRLYGHLINSIQQHGKEPLDELTNAFECEWDGETTKQYWNTNVIRTVIVALWRAGISSSWAINRLNKLESNMLDGLDISGRMNELYEQINAWIELREFSHVRSLLATSLKVSLGVGYSKDYQLIYWINWYQHIAHAVPSKAIGRYQRIAEVILSLNRSTEGQSKAAILLMNALFEISPRRAVMLYNYFLDNTLISFQEGLGSLIKQSVGINNTNLKLVNLIFCKMLVPLSKGVPDDIVKDLIHKIFISNGRIGTINASKEIHNSADVFALSHIRQGLHYAIAQSIQMCGISDIDIAKYTISPPDDSYIPEDRTILELKSGTRMSLIEVIDSIKDANDFIRLFREEEQYKHFDWTSVIERIIGRLQISDIDLLIRIFNEEFESWEMLNILAEQLITIGDTQRAQTVLMYSIRHIKEGRFYFYDRVNRFDTFALFKQVDHDQAIRYTYSFLVSELTKEKESYIFRSAFNIMEGIYRIICDKIPYEAIGNELDNYLEALFANEQITSIGIFDQDIQEDTVNRALVEILFGNIDHDVSIIGQMSREAIIELVRDDMPECINSLINKLASKPPSISMLLMIAEALTTVNKHREIFTPIVHKLSHDTNILVAMIARHISSKLNLEVPSMSPKDRISLPPIYSLVINEDQPFDIWYDGDLKEGEDLPDTQDPRELTKPNNWILRGVSKECGIPFINLCMRAVEIVRECKQEEMLSRRYEKQIMRRLEYTGLKMTYVRPRFRVMHSAIFSVIGELANDGRLSDRNISEIYRLCHPYDPAFIMINPSKRPDDITPIPGIGDRIADLHEWIVNQPTHFNPKNKIDDYTILGEEFEIRQLTYGMPSEHRETVCVAEKQDDYKEISFGKIIDCPVSKYQDSNFQDQLTCLVVRNTAYMMIETGNISWLAFNPFIARQLQWKFKEDDWFHWTDDSGNTMVKSVWWQDGLIEWHDRHLKGNSVEVAKGWRVIISSMALSQLAERYQDISRICRLSRVYYQEDGTKHEKKYEWQSKV